VLLFDVADAESREAASTLSDDPVSGPRDSSMLRHLISEFAHPWHSRYFLSVKAVPLSIPVEGQVCRRLGQRHPKKADLTLDDVPVEKPESKVGLTERDGYWLTPIEVPFYDALRDRPHVRGAALGAGYGTEGTGSTS
jgi:hypothetical protein